MSKLGSDSENMATSREKTKIINQLKCLKQKFLQDVFVIPQALLRILNSDWPEL